MVHPTFPLMGRRMASLASRMPQSSYYKNAQPGDSLLRARRAYLFPNIVSGIGIFCFAISVFAYTIHAVGQDEFADVPMPDGPAPAAGAPHASVNRSAGPAPTGSQN